jgi:hypothetical protein
MADSFFGFDATLPVSFASTLYDKSHVGAAKEKFQSEKLKMKFLQLSLTILWNILSTLTLNIFFSRCKIRF